MGQHVVLSSVMRVAGGAQSLAAGGLPHSHLATLPLPAPTRPHTTQRTAKSASQSTAEPHLGLRNVAVLLVSQTPCGTTHKAIASDRTAAALPSQKQLPWAAQCSRPPRPPLAGTGGAPPAAAGSRRRWPRLGGCRGQQGFGCSAGCSGGAAAQRWGQLVAHSNGLGLGAASAHRTADANEPGCVDGYPRQAWAQATPPFVLTSWAKHSQQGACVGWQRHGLRYNPQLLITYLPPSSSTMTRSARASYTCRKKTGRAQQRSGCGWRTQPQLLAWEESKVVHAR